MQGAMLLKTLHSHLPWRVVLWIGWVIEAQLVFVQPAIAAGCVQYDRQATESPLLCHDRTFASCNYVSPIDSLTIPTAEAQLSEVFNLAEIGVDSGSLSQRCFNSFVSFYCHQVYTLCEQVRSMDTLNYIPRTGGLCQSDCEQVIQTDCGSQGWSYLGNLIEQLQGGNLIQTPSLLQNCSSDSNDLASCIPLNSGASSCTSPMETPTTSPQPPTGTIPTTLILGVSLGVGIPLISLGILLAVAVCCCRSSSSTPEQTATKDIWYEEMDHAAVPKKETDSPDIDHRSTMRGTLMMRTSMIHGALLDVNLSPRTGTMVKRLGTKDFLKMSPKQRLQALEFPHGNICITKNIGETNFGKTYLGEATGLRENELSTTVFIKSLRERATSKLRQHFTVEMSWASGFSHPNILALLAVCNKDEPRYMVFEHLEYGTLKDFLQSIDSAWFDFDEALNEEASTCDSSANPVLGIDDLMGIICQVAEGMDYLANKAFVHKDLATRNCHVGQGLRVKIANFGLSYDLHSKDYCSPSSAKGTPLPLRWLAPETLQHKKFSIYSDIWAFGVLAWEVFSFGVQPYADLSNAQVAEHILNRQLLPRPDKCPENVYRILLKCWNKSPGKRPWFSVLGRDLGKALGNLDSEAIKKYRGAHSTPELGRHHLV